MGGEGGSFRSAFSRHLPIPRPSPKRGQSDIFPGGPWLGDVGPVGLALSLGFASGAMAYVVYGEILPEAYLIYRSKAPAFAAMAGEGLGKSLNLG